MSNFANLFQALGCFGLLFLQPLFKLAALLARILTNASGCCLRLPCIRLEFARVEAKGDQELVNDSCDTSLPSNSARLKLKETRRSAKEPRVPLATRRHRVQFMRQS